MTVFLIVLACVVWAVSGVIGGILFWRRDFDITLLGLLWLFIGGCIVGLVGLLILGVPWYKLSHLNPIVIRKKET